MKKVKVVKSHEVEVKTFILDDFIQDKAPNDTMKNVTKKELKKLAQKLGLVYDDAQIVFAKKLLSAYLTGE
ncbi:hypothetical protein [Sulfurovum sp.]|uniref:hypothetical protein n=1 Tax=Sulfurovum sp. TaxID=1969726 RepID=UPI002867C929|nr:hypothetical protein [Sulfurovum sp.]